MARRLSHRLPRVIQILSQNLLTTLTSDCLIPQEGLPEGLSVDVDYYQYDYVDIMTRENSAALLAADNAIIQAYADANGVSLADAAVASARNHDQVIRNSSGILLRLLPNFSNADSAEVSGVDVTSSYSFDNSWGNWRVGLQAAWIGTYDVKVGSTTFDAVGSYNFDTCCSSVA